MSKNTTYIDDRPWDMISDEEKKKLGVREPTSEEIEEAKRLARELGFNLKNKLNKNEEAE